MKTSFSDSLLDINSGTKNPAGCGIFKTLSYMVGLPALSRLVNLAGLNAVAAHINASDSTVYLCTNSL